MKNDKDQCDNHKCKRCDDTACKCDCTDLNKNKLIDKILCNVHETHPQTIKDASDWFNKLLDECGVKLP